MKFRNENGSVRWRSVVFAVMLAVWVTAAIAETYISAGIPGLLVSTDTYAISVPLLQLRQVPADLTNPSGGEVWNEPTRKAFRAYVGGQILGFTQAATTTAISSPTLSNPTSNTTFNMWHPFVAGQLSASKKVRFHAWGKYTSTSSPAKNLAFTLYYGSIALATTGNVSTTTGTDKAWEVEGDVQLRTAGASGTQVNRIRATVETSNTQDSVCVSRAAGAIDTVGANRLELGVNFDASDAGNAITCEEFTVETLN